jgi:2Fe-2S iron-sulfur cluster protein/sarcosine oxidase alpha subunit family protein
VTARRLAPLPGSGTAPVEVTFTFDGRPIRAPEGEPLAVAMLAADRPILSRSFRFHRPRGLMCDTGQCGWCECEVDSRPSVRSCQVPVHDGLVARSEHAWPSVDRDLFGWLDLGSRWIPPTFYHHRFLRPRRLRKRYLDVIRGFGGRGRLRSDGGNGGVARGRAVRELETEVLVVGGGRSGIAAADGSAAVGSSVVLLEAVSGRARPTRADVRVLDGATAVGWYEGVVTAIDADTLWSIRARSVIAATGSYERVPSVRGADRPGVMGARRALQLVTGHRVLPGERPLLVGHEAELAEVADVFGRAGASVVGPVPTAVLRRVHGRRRVTGAIVEIDGRSRRESVDLIVFGDRSPNLDLVLAAGAEVRDVGGVLVPVLDDSGRTSVPLLSVVGSATGQAFARAPAALRVPPGRALVCFCEDVHADEIRAQLAAGYGDPELVKRRTGAFTGPCQGKYCLQAFATTVAGAGAPVLSLPTARPPLRPVRLGDLVPGADAREP